MMSTCSFHLSYTKTSSRSFKLSPDRWTKLEMTPPGHHLHCFQIYSCARESCICYCSEGNVLKEAVNTKPSLKKARKNTTSHSDSDAKHAYHSPALWKTERVQKQDKTPESERNELVWEKERQTWRCGWSHYYSDNCDICYTSVFFYLPLGGTTVLHMVV